MQRAVVMFFVLWFGLMAEVARASISLPLQGYCKPGRYFPVRVQASVGSSSTSISGDGCMTVVVDGSAGSMVTPVLVEREPHEIICGNQHLPLHAAGAGERLVGGLDGAEIQMAAAIFPGSRLIPISLDTGELLPGPAVAWETLDAIVLPAEIFSRVSDFQRSTLLGGGVTLIAVGPLPPDFRWPWHPVGSVWVLSCSLAGPGGDLVNPNVYAAVVNWTPGWSSAVRGQVMGVGALLVLGTIGLSLWPGRLSMGISIGLLLAASGGVAYWRHTLGAVDHAGGDVIINKGSMTQLDQYVYERAREDNAQLIPWAGCTHPLFNTPSAVERSQMVLHQSDSGELAFSYQAKAGHTLAFLRREVRPGVVLPMDLSNNSPMQEVARSEYRDAEHRIVGQIKGSGDRWAGVVMRGTIATVENR
jgi:hypothetical protein